MKLAASWCIAVLVTVAQPAYAWNGRGHMTVAAVAWKQLTPAAKQRATQLLKLNPNYSKWVNGVPAAERDIVAFVRAATWPDQIRSDPAYQDDGYEPSSPTASQNIGYSDMLLHRYWHFKDLSFSPDNTPTVEPFAPNAVTQIEAFSTALGSSTLSDNVKSYDLAWLMHLVGDIHQPLHATSRYTSVFRSGDNGGNGVKICSEAATYCDVEHASALHSFWDCAVGTSDKPLSAVGLAGRLPVAPETLVSITDPQRWAEESLQLAKQAAYAAPVGTAKGPYRLTRSYRATVGSIAERRISLAGTRLANILNAKLN